MTGGDGEAPATGPWPDGQRSQLPDGPHRPGRASPWTAPDDAGAWGGAPGPAGATGGGSPRGAGREKWPVPGPAAGPALGWAPGQRPAVSWPGGATDPAAGARPPVMTSPSGLFPSGPPRPVYREPAPVRLGAATLGVAAGALWMLLFGLLSTSAGGYAWASIVAGLLGGGAAAVLARYGDRGVAVGVALSVGFGLAIAAAVVIAHWAGGQWVLW